MDIKNVFASDRVLARALDVVVKQDEYPRNVFNGNGLRNRLGVGAIKPRTPERRLLLREQAVWVSRLLSETDERLPQLEHRVDEAKLSVLAAAKRPADGAPIQLNGKSYVLLDMGGRTYTYADITDTTKYEVRKTPFKYSEYSRVHLISKDGNKETDLGRVIIDNTGLAGWIARAPDGSSADADLSTKLRQHPGWKDGNFDDSDARNELSQKGRRSFLLYSSNRKGIYKIAYKDKESNVQVKQFNSTTGMIIDKYNKSEERDVFLLIKDIEAYQK